MTRRGLEYIDATCPMVKLIHEKIRDVERLGRMPVVIGHEGHEEVQGIVGQVRKAIVVGTPEEATGPLFKDVTQAGIVVQSTFISEEARRIHQRIREFVPDVDFHDTICRPTKIRQKEVEEHALTADDVIVIGSKGSANTMHLYRIARKKNPRTYLVDSPDAVDGLEIPADANVFIASGASTPEELIFDVVRRLEAGGKAGQIP
jgi:4-hydroxy-3-methylbut-2-enyl diphosphate reductase